MDKAFNSEDLSAIYNLIIELGITCPISGSKNWTNVRQFNLMFKTDLGSVSGESTSIFLRPETAQGIFVNYLNVQKTGRKKIPLESHKLVKLLETKSLQDNLFLE